MGQYAGEALRINTRDVGHFGCVEGSVFIIVQRIEVARALLDNTLPDRGLGGSFFLIGELAVTIGVSNPVSVGRL